jgi:hypothetical protein
MMEQRWWPSFSSGSTTFPLPSSSSCSADVLMRHFRYWYFTIPTQEIHMGPAKVYYLRPAQVNFPSAIQFLVLSRYVDEAF